MNISFMTALSERLSINLPAIILRGIKTVSYTHLDVYKRQLFNQVWIR